MIWITLFLIALVTSYLLTGLIRRYALRRGILDVPNQRSSHEKVTPRGGGAAIAGVTLAGWLFYNLLFAGPEMWWPVLGCVAGAGLIAGVSWADDLHPVAVPLRLGAHGLGAGLAIWSLGYWSTVYLPLIGSLSLGWLGLGVTFLWIVGLTNAYNFMDGIDGIAGSQGLIAGLGWAVLGDLSGQPVVIGLGLLIAAGSLGFLGHNWPPARIFMGDVGSAFLGYTFAILPLMAASEAVGYPWPGAPVAGVLLLWPFVFDPLVTFIRRWRHGENVFAAHRSHLYQRLTILTFQHRTVTLLYAGLALVGVVLALVWAAYPQSAAMPVAVGGPLAALALWSYVNFQEVDHQRQAQMATSPQQRVAANHPVPKGLTSMPNDPPFIRLFDLLAAGSCLLLISPLFLTIGLLIKLSSMGSIFHRVERVGQNGKPFKLYTFNRATRHITPYLSEHPHPFVTALYRFLRFTRLDALPQLINVIRGEMSIIGPAPETPAETAVRTPGRQRLLTVRPGMISPASLFYWQAEVNSIKKRGKVDHREQILRHKMDLDFNYLQQRTVWSDLLLIFKTGCLSLIHGVQVSPALKLRNRHVFLMDILALLMTPAIALILRLDGLAWWSQFGRALVLFTLISLLIKLAIFYHMGLYRRYWHYTSLHDLLLVAKAVALATMALALLLLSAQPALAYYDLTLPRLLPLIDGLLTGVAIAGIRLALRGLYHYQERQSPIGGRRVLIVGAGEAGSLVVKEMRANPQLQMEPVAFVDDDPAKVGTHIQSLPVVGMCGDLPELVEKYQVQRIVVAVPSAPLGRQKELVDRCQQTGRTVYSLPGIYELLAGHKTISQLPEVDIHRLLKREPVEIDDSEVTAALQDAVVLVTGAGGSIGSELCRQIARCRPREIILLGHGENSIFEISLDLRLSFPTLATKSTIVDVRDRERVYRMVQKYKPDIIFHAAAHKHVPFMQENAEEALTNNVLGTKNVLDAAETHQVKRFVLISTDKAVNPTSIMGATKRLAELLVIAAAQRSGRAYMAVRFGNVLGSRGSVIPIFQRQIAAGGPVTITHPDMERYFMTIPEAVQLVLQAAVLGRGGEVFVLDMGEQVRILDLATDLIKLSGLEPGRDIELVTSGIRPGEKLSEELFLDGESYRRTRHPKVFMAAHSAVINGQALNRAVTDLVALARHHAYTDSAAHGRFILSKICDYTAPYQPQSGSPKPIVRVRSKSPDASYPYPSSMRP